MRVTLFEPVAPDRRSATNPNRVRAMPLQNRVDPWGRLCAVAARGAWTGNRGILHDESKRIVRPWAGKAWITCTLELGDKRREVFGHRTWSELFFLDEATAFAAGHRPCGYCRRERFTAFKAAWLAANSIAVPGDGVAIRDIDRVLHEERAARSGGKVTFPSPMNRLPSGAMFEREGEAWLIRDGRLHRWSFDGYLRTDLPITDEPVKVLTPVSIVRAFELGLVPQVHPSCSE